MASSIAARVVPSSTWRSAVDDVALLGSAGSREAPGLAGHAERSRRAGLEPLGRDQAAATAAHPVRPRRRSVERRVELDKVLFSLGEKPDSKCPVERGRRSVGIVLVVAPLHRRGGCDTVELLCAEADHGRRGVPLRTQPRHEVRTFGPARFDHATG